jgi:S1-C subfamily serine protease
MTWSKVIVTNAHVVRGEETATAVLSSGQKLEAKVVYIDPEMDIALVKVEGTGFQHLALTDVANIRQGQTVVAIGNPRNTIFGDEGHRQCSGMVSNDPHGNPRSHMMVYLSHSLNPIPRY